MKKKFVSLVTMLLYSVWVFGQWSWINPSPQGNDYNDVQFVNQNVGYLVGDCSTFLKTTDSGLSWKALDDTIDGDILDLDFLTESIGYAISKNESNEFFINITDDGGLEWQQILIPATSTPTSVLFIDYNTGYITGENGLLLKSTNGGFNWQDISIETESTIYSLFFIDSNIGFAAAAKGIIFKTVNGGQTWTPYYTGTEKDNKSVYFINESSGFAVGTDNYVLKTIDGGVNWGTANSDLIDACNIQFIDQNIGIIGCTNGNLLKTNDSGNTWNIIPYTGSPSLFSSLWFESESFGVIVGMHGCTSRTTDGGLSWNSNASISGDILSNVAFFSDSIGLIGGEDGRMLKTTDEGKSWINLNTSVTGDIIKFDFPSSNIGYLISSLDNTQYLYKSLDEGENWLPVNSHNKDNISDIFFLDELSGYLTSQNEILHTIDGGESWTVYNADPPISFNKIYFANSQIGYVTGVYNYNQEFIFKTIDGGQTWEQSLVESTNIISICGINADTVYALSLYAGLFKTENGGVRWIYSDVFEENAIDLGKSLYFTSNSVGYFLGSSEDNHGVVYKTNDAGVTWYKTLESTEHFNDVSFITSGNVGFIVGENGAILKTVNAGGNVDAKNIGKDKEGLLIYPNPSNNYIKVSTSGLGTKNTEASIYNFQGKCMQKLNLNMADEVVIDISNYIPGIYIFQINRGSYTVSERFIVY